MSDPRSVPQQHRPLAVKSLSHRVVYADTFSVKATPIDCSITFAAQTVLNISGPQGIANQVPAIQEEVTVAMSLAILKSLFIHMEKIVEILESALGPIRITQGLVPTDAQMETVRQLLRNNPLVD